MKSVDKVVEKHIKNVVNKDRIASISEEAHLHEDLLIDSLKMVSAFASIIHELDISITEFTNDELVTIKTMGDLKTLFQSKLAAREHPVRI